MKYRRKSKDKLERLLEQDQIVIKINKDSYNAVRHRTYEWARKHRLKISQRKNYECTEMTVTVVYRPDEEIST